MKDCLDVDALHQLLRKNWSSFIRKNKLVALVLSELRHADLPRADGVTPMDVQGMHFTISSIEMTQTGMLLWIDFVVPHPQSKTVKVGTCEAMLSYGGLLEPIQLLGNVVASA